MTLTAYGRGDVYHTDDAESTAVPIYRGTDGWHARAIGALGRRHAMAVRRAAVRRHAAARAAGPARADAADANLDIPNEDARSVDLEDSNLFALNRFPGYDRWEDTSRVTYGVDWSLERPNLSIENTIGQSYRLTDSSRNFP